MCASSISGIFRFRLRCEAVEARGRLRYREELGTSLGIALALALPRKILNGCFSSGVSLVGVLILAKRSAGGCVRDGWAFDGGRIVLLPVAHYLLSLLQDHFPVYHQELLSCSSCDPEARAREGRDAPDARDARDDAIGALICPYPLCDFLRK